MPLMSWESLVIIVAVAVAWGLLAFSSRRRTQRRRRQVDAWIQFARGHRELDHELDKVWHHE